MTNISKFLAISIRFKDVEAEQIALALEKAKKDRVIQAEIFKKGLEVLNYLKK